MTAIILGIIYLLGIALGWKTFNLIIITCLKYIPTFLLNIFKAISFFLLVPRALFKSYKGEEEKAEEALDKFGKNGIGYLKMLKTGKTNMFYMPDDKTFDNLYKHLEKDGIKI